MMDIEYIKKDLKNSVGDRLYIHCINVQNTAVELANFYNISIEKASLAGLLHDCGKLLSEKVGNLEHAILGRQIAKEKYGINDKDILNAILYHTTGRENMTMLEKIIYIADKIEPNRSYDGVEQLRKLVYENIDLSIVKSLENTFSYLKYKGIEIDNQSIITYNSII